MSLSYNSTLSQSVEMVDAVGSCKKGNRIPIKINWYRYLHLVTKIEIFSPYERKYTTFDLKYGWQYKTNNAGILLAKLQNKFRIWEASQ